MYIYRRDSVWTVLAPAKLNLFFEVLGKRSDGYHEIVSLVLPIRLFDVLRFEPTEDGVLDFDCYGGGSDVPTGDDNIVVRALRLLQRKSGSALGARVRLFKRIPSRAGLGGGSSDAAAALAAASRAWKLDYTTETLASLSAAIGSDCPVFFQSGASLVRGRGERIKPVGSVPPMYFVLLKPSEGLSTAEVYGECMRRHDGRLRRVDEVLDRLRNGRPIEAGRLFFNRLETAAAGIWPRFDEIRRMLKRLDCAAVGMTGSGSAFFGLCRHARHAGSVAGRLRQRAGRDDRVFCTTNLRSLVSWK